MAYSAAAERLEKNRMRTLLMVVRVAANGDEKSFGKMLDTFD